MKIWINKNEKTKPTEDFDNSYIFSINRDFVGTTYSNLAETLNRMGCEYLPPVFEDLFIIGLSIFAIDKRISRKFTVDSWTREFDVSIPVLEYDKWKSTSDEWNKTLSFLTGDVWNICFRKSKNTYTLCKKAYRKTIEKPKCDVVCLFSGGLDSFCGAIELLEHGYSPCLIGHNEYPKLRKKQESLVSMFRSEYDRQSPQFVSFTANSRAPVDNEGNKIEGSENTSRGRSLLFLCVALCFASLFSENTPVYIPENGFIGLNIPLTNNRKGSCSTRTTHPYFLTSLNKIIESVGIKNQIINFYAYKNKREIVNEVKDKIAFKKGFAETISCSHPCNNRWNKKEPKEYPMNCGYCYPCIIRKTSLLDIGLEKEKYNQKELTLKFLKHHIHEDKTNDFNAMINSVYRYQNINDSELRRLIKLTGPLSNDEIDQFVLVYKKTMNDVIELFSYDKELKKYLKL